jgi:hypothetical protein
MYKDINIYIPIYWKKAAFTLKERTLCTSGKLGIEVKFIENQPVPSEAIDDDISQRTWIKKNS